MTMKDHVNRLIRSCNYQLRRIRSIRRSISTTAAVQLVHSLIVSRVDYCNSILAGLPVYQLDRVQSVLNVAARLVYGRNRFDHVTDLLRDRLHWLRVPQRITFKCCLLVYKALHGLAPPYLASSCIPKSTIQRSGLRSSAEDHLCVPKTKTKFGERSFNVAGPSAWNSLPDFVRDAESVDIFKSRLKTHLFRQSYGAS